MRVGVMSGAEAPMPLSGYVERARAIESAGLDDLWMAHTFSFDAISALGWVGSQVPRIGLGTAVTPTYPRHPTALAQQALTAAAMSGNRFTLGIGLSHKVLIEDMLGLSYARPAAHMRAYLEALLPLLQGERVEVSNSEYAVKGLQLVTPGAEPPPVLLAALGPAMLRLAGELADGTSLWMVGERTLTEHIMPRLQRAAEVAARPQPKVIHALPVAVVADPDAAREKVAQALTVYGQLPSYRAMLDREGVSGPADLAVLGDEALLMATLDRLADLGVSHFNASIMDVEEGAWARTQTCLATWCSQRA
ncbi:MAG: TIGR03564 family F420-dependent LLM class oxidoreductase [Gammaproteobacteria bacterium]|nr:MAG: TIGR03564 family F420-dependent LLM class oxidoreductase [Gammaproteobacteria bacterium]